MFYISFSLHILPTFIERGDSFLVSNSYSELVNDKGEWADSLSRELYFNIGDIKFYMIHNIKDIPNNLKNVDVIVFGHSHKYFYEVVDNIAYLNPGSCGKKRFNLSINFVIMTIKNKNYNIENINII